MLPLDCWSSPGPGWAGSLILRLFMREDRRRSSPWLVLAGDAPLGERCRPALIVAAAWREDRDGDLGEGGLWRKVSALVMEILRGRAAACGELEVEGGSELRSGGMLEVCATAAFGERRVGRSWSRIGAVTWWSWWDKEMGDGRECGQ